LDLHRPERLALDHVSGKSGWPRFTADGVGGQNSWELKRVKMAVFEGYVEKSDKIDVN